MRIIYGCPSDDTPTGGVKVIYKQSEILNNLGIESGIWHPQKPDFVCSWFKNNVRRIADAELNPATDLIVIPEIWISAYFNNLKALGFKVAVYVQNCYFTHFNLNPAPNNLTPDLMRAADLLLSISDDTSQFLTDLVKADPNKVILQRYSIDQSLFNVGAKKKLITYMPRKLPQHSLRVVAALRPLLPPDWVISAIEKMNETEVASVLSQSAVFMSFSEFEGLPVPPVEAAISGNLVIGYHGEGGRQYWREPNFVEIECGNVQKFALTVVDYVRQLESGQFQLNSLLEGIKLLKNEFSLKTELDMLNTFVGRARDFYPQSSA